MSAKVPVKIRLDDETQLDVRCQIHQLSFSPHTDAKGIMDLVKFLSPKHVMLVHGEKPKMATLKEKIESELGIECHYPANNETLSVPTTHHIKAGASDPFLQSCSYPRISIKKPLDNDDSSDEVICIHDNTMTGGILVNLQPNAKVITQSEFMVDENHEEVCSLLPCHKLSQL